MGFSAQVVVFFGIRVANITLDLEDFCASHGVEVWDKTGFDTPAEHHCYYIGYRLGAIAIRPVDGGHLRVSASTAEMEEQLMMIRNMYDTDAATTWLVTCNSW